MSSEPVHDQRPFHICPDCNAHNAKFLETCWRCNRDMREGALSPNGVLGYRLEQLDEPAKPADEKK